MNEPNHAIERTANPRHASCVRTCRASGRGPLIAIVGPQKSMKTISRVVLLLVMLLSTASGRGLNDGIATVVPDDHPMLAGPFFTFMVVSADRLSSEPHSNANPPEGIFTVHEVLRGLVSAEKVELKWKPSDAPEDHIDGGPGQREHQNWYRQPLASEWYGRPLPGPTLGEKIIVFAVKQSSPSSPVQRYDVRAAFRLTDDNRQTVLREIGATDRRPNAQRMILLTITILAAVSVSRLAAAFRGTLTIRNRALVHGSLAWVISLIVYLYYEAGNRTGGIRVDLFLLYPMLAFNLVLLLAACSWLALRNTKNA